MLLAALALLLATACGPNALPAKQEPAAAQASQPQQATGAPPQAPAPVAQLFGGSANTKLPGRLLFINDSTLWTYENGEAHPLATGDTWQQPQWSPDGTKFAYVYRGSNFSEIFVVDTAAQQQARLTRSQSTILDDNSWNFHPVWSPDGKQIAYISDTGSYNPAVWLMNADGTGRRQLATPGVVTESVDGLSWSPDGKLLAMAAFSGQDPSQIATLTMTPGVRATAKVVTQHSGGTLDPAWSPDSRWLAYAGRDGRSMHVYLAAADGSGEVALTTGDQLDRAPAWSPDGEHLAFLSARTGQFEVWALDLKAGTGADGAATLTAANVRQITKGLGLDATSGISWSR